MEENYSRSKMFTGALITGLGGLILGNGLSKRSVLRSVIGAGIAYHGYLKIKEQSKNYKKEQMQ